MSTEAIVATATALFGGLGAAFVYVFNYFKPMIGAKDEIQQLRAVVQQQMSELKQMKEKAQAVLNEQHQQRKALKLIIKMAEDGDMTGKNVAVVANTLLENGVKMVAVEDDLTETP